jgi:hypothetical protein
MGNKKKLVSFAERQWETLWKPLVTTNGRIDKAKLMTELADFSILMEEAGKVYHHVTGGQINTVRVMATDVINAATEADNEALKEILADEKEQWDLSREVRGELNPVVERLEDVCYIRLGGPTVIFEGRHVHVTIPGGTYSAAWSSETGQLFLDDVRPLPADWVDTAKEAAKSLLSKEG